MTTRCGKGPHQIEVKSVSVMYNLCNEPWLKYGMVLVADKDLNKASFTSARLKRGDVLYLENHAHRYELCFIREKMIEPDSKSQNHHSNSAKDDHVNIYRFSRCKKNLPQSAMLKEGVPLPVDLLEVIDDDLDWEDILWSETAVWVGGKEYKIVRMLFLSPKGVPSII